jgi:transcriptional regulator
MYRPPAFAIDDAAVLRAFVQDNPFATVVRVSDGAPTIAYAPVLLDGDTLRFHLAKANAVAAAGEGERLLLSFVGPHAYVSPDWYDTQGRVPTWNYLAVEATGIVTRVAGDDLRQLLVDLSAAEEAHLKPKPPWVIDKVPEEKMRGLFAAIVGFSVKIETLTGKFKLSQNTTPADIDGVIAGLEKRGDAASLAVAQAMRKAIER